MRASPPSGLAALSGPALLAHEARVREGAVPHALAGRAVPPGSHLLLDDAFLLRTASGHAFHYVRGAGVTVERTAGADPAEQELWLNGSVYAAIAAINGFLPFHASAVAWDGRVYALSGPSGAGKSTLAAALGRHGLPLFCDDTLVLDLSDPAGVRCLPGHKRLKLSDEALALTGARGQEKVGPMIAKRYAEPAGGTVQAVLPLARLIFLADGEPVRLDRVDGARRIALLDDDHYTASYVALARRASPSERFAWLAALAARIPMQRLTRPRDAARFAALTAQLADWIKRDGRS